MSRVHAELTVVLTDGSSITEYFNQAEMAQFTRSSMLERIARQQSVTVFDGDAIEIPAERVASVTLAVHDLAAV